MTWGSQRPCSVNAKKASKRAAAATARAEVSVCRPRAHVPNTIMDLYFTLFFFSVLVIVLPIAEEAVLVTSRHTPNCYVLLTFMCVWSLFLKTL